MENKPAFNLHNKKKHQLQKTTSFKDIDIASTVQPSGGKALWLMWILHEQVILAKQHDNGCKTLTYIDEGKESIDP